MQGDHDPQADQDGLDKEAAPRWAFPELRHVAAAKGRNYIKITSQEPKSDQSCFESFKPREATSLEKQARVGQAGQVNGSENINVIKYFL